MVGENDLAAVAPVLKKVGLDLFQIGLVLLHDDLVPGGGHLLNGAENLGAPHQLQVVHGDGVGVVDIDVVIVVGLEGQIGKGAAQLGQALRRVPV